MPGSLPKVKRVDGGMPVYLWVVFGGIIALLVVVLALLLTGNLFDTAPASDEERDYAILLEALKDDPNNSAVLMTLAEAEFDLGRTSDAFDHAQKAVKNAKGATGINLRYAMLLVRDGQVDKAVAPIEAEIKVSGDSNPEPFFLLAQIQSDQKKYEDALKNMKSGLKLAPQAADMRVVYAQILEKAGEKEDAVKQYQEALRFLPDNEEAAAALKRLGATVPTDTASPHGQ